MCSMYAVEFTIDSQIEMGLTVPDFRWLSFRVNYEQFCFEPWIQENNTSRNSRSRFHCVCLWIHLTCSSPRLTLTQNVESKKLHQTNLWERLLRKQLLCPCGLIGLRVCCIHVCEEEWSFKKLIAESKDLQWILILRMMKYCGMNLYILLIYSSLVEQPIMFRKYSVEYFIGYKGLWYPSTATRVRAVSSCCFCNALSLLSSGSLERTSYSFELTLQLHLDLRFRMHGAVHSLVLHLYILLHYVIIMHFVVLHLICKTWKMSYLYNDFFYHWGKIFIGFISEEFLQANWVE